MKNKDIENQNTLSINYFCRIRVQFIGHFLQTKTNFCLWQSKSTRTVINGRTVRELHVQYPAAELIAERRIHKESEACPKINYQSWSEPAWSQNHVWSSFHNAQWVPEKLVILKNDSRRPKKINSPTPFVKIFSYAKRDIVDAACTLSFSAGVIQRVWCGGWFPHVAGACTQSRPLIALNSPLSPHFVTRRAVWWAPLPFRNDPGLFRFFVPTLVWIFFF